MSCLFLPGYSGMSLGIGFVFDMRTIGFYSIFTENSDLNLLEVPFDWPKCTIDFGKSAGDAGDVISNWWKKQKSYSHYEPHSPIPGIPSGNDCYTSRTGSHGPVEISDLPIDSMVICGSFHRFMLTFTRQGIWYWCVPTELSLKPSLFVYFFAAEN